MNPVAHGIFSILIYLLICMVFIVISNDSYQRSLRLEKSNKKLSYLIIIITSIAFALFNKYNTVTSVIGSDRQNYLQDFNGRLTSSPAFDWYLSTFRSITGNNYELTLYITTFICCFVLFFVYKYCEYSTPYTLMFLLSTNFVFFSFTGLKQILTCTFANIFFLLILSKKKNIIIEIITWITVLLACLFHVTGFILIPIYFVMKLNYRNSKKAMRIMVILLLLIIFMRPLLLGLTKLLGTVLPQLSYKILEYFAEDTQQTTDGTFAVFKGIPYYILTYYAFKRRNRYLNLIFKYDQLFILSFIASLFVFSTIISYWLSRFAIMFCFPLGILFGQMIENSNSRAEKNNLEILVLVPMLFFTLRANMLVYLNYGGY